MLRFFQCRLPQPTYRTLLWQSPEPTQSGPLAPGQFQAVAIHPRLLQEAQLRADLDLITKAEAKDALRKVAYLMSLFSQ